MVNFNPNLNPNFGFQAINPNVNPNLQLRGNPRGIFGGQMPNVPRPTGPAVMGAPMTPMGQPVPPQIAPPAPMPPVVGGVPNYGPPPGFNPNVPVNAGLVPPQQTGYQQPYLPQNQYTQPGGKPPTAAW